MTATAKMLLGALATVALAAVLHGPMGLGARCAALAAPMAQEAGR